MQIPAVSPFSASLPPGVEGMPSPAMTGVEQLADALKPGFEMSQNALGSLLNGLDRGRLNMSEGEKAALQMQVSQFSALVTLAMNISLGIGKACEKLQQA